MSEQVNGVDYKRDTYDPTINALIERARKSGAIKSFRSEHFDEMNASLLELPAEERPKVLAMANMIADGQVPVEMILPGLEEKIAERKSKAKATPAPAVVASAASTVVEPPAVQASALASPAPATEASKNVDKYPDTDGLVKLAPAVFAMTETSILDSAYTATIGGKEVTRYRPIVGVFVRKYARKDQPPLYLIQLHEPAMVTNTFGRTVEAKAPALVQMLGVFGLHPLGELNELFVEKTGKHPIIMVRPIGYTKQLDGSNEWAFDIRAMPDGKEADGSIRLKLVDLEG